ncbi:hypothetical protein Tco_1175825 [Tanacetum coccineum]
MTMFSKIRDNDDNDLQDERQDQPKEEEVEPRRCKRARTEKLFGPDFVSFMVENEPTSYREAERAQNHLVHSVLLGAQSNQSWPLIVVVFSCPMDGFRIARLSMVVSEVG